MSDLGREIATVNLTPTWQSILPMLIAVIESPATEEGRKIAKEELHRMACIADAYVAERGQK